MTPLAAQPNERAKRSLQGTRPELTPRQEAYVAFFRQLLEDVRRQYPSITQASKVYPQNWCPFPVGRTGFEIDATFTRDATLRVDLRFAGDRERNKRAFDALVRQRDVLEEELGYSITWDRQDDKKRSRVFVSRMGSVDDSPEMLAELREWAVQKVGDFDRVFRPRVQQLEL